MDFAKADRPAKKGPLAFTCNPKYFRKPGIGMDVADHEWLM